MNITTSRSGLDIQDGVLSPVPCLSVIALLSSIQVGEGISSETRLMDCIVQAGARQLLHRPGFLRLGAGALWVLNRKGVAANFKMKKINK